MGERSWIVGSLPDCDIRVESPTVSGRHCRLSTRGEAFLLEDLHSTNGTFVGDERIAGPRIVHRGDSVSLGRDTPLPWPAPSVSITVGRSPDNDLMIPMDTVSSHHARLEREGRQVILVDLGSTNGTAINDPLNKITRAPLEPTDFVFLGTHRIAAADLIAALSNNPARQSTMLEREPPEQLRRSAQPRQSGEPALPERQPLSPLAMSSPTAWAVGLALGGLCVVAIFGGRWMLRPGTATADVAAPSLSGASAGTTDASSGPSSDTPPATRKVADDPRRSPPDEAIVRQAQESVALVGLRIGGELLLKSVKVTCWAYGADEVVCPTAILERLDGLRKQSESHDVSLVVCTPTKTIAILSHRTVGAGFSVAKLEASLDVVCGIASGPTALDPIPGQKLAVLSGRAESDDSSTIQRGISYVSVDHVERDSDRSPLVLECKCDAAAGPATGSPVFDASGRVVGCVEASVEKTVRVVPVSRLVSLPQS